MLAASHQADCAPGKVELPSSGVQNYLIIFFVVFVRLLGLRGRAGEREGRREGGGVDFPRETLLPSHF